MLHMEIKNVPKKKKIMPTECLDIQNVNLAVINIFATTTLYY